MDTSSSSDISDEDEPMDDRSERSRSCDRRNDRNVTMVTMSTDTHDDRNMFGQGTDSQQSADEDGSEHSNRTAIRTERHSQTPANHESKTQINVRRPLVSAVRFKPYKKSTVSTASQCRRRSPLTFK